MENEREILVEVNHLNVTYGSGKKAYEAVQDANFKIYKGETFGLVGESGSGKTTIGRAILRILPTSGGEILYKGQKINGRISRQEENVRQALLDVGLLPEFASRFPHEFSGGQRQRIGIARALYKQANILFFDEATSALDSGTEEGINRSIAELSQHNRDLTIVVIAHRESSLEYCDRIITLDNNG